jgi:hypothetical protein
MSEKFFYRSEEACSVAIFKHGNPIIRKFSSQPLRQMKGGEESRRHT